jgi:hypothetical protein
VSSRFSSCFLQSTYGARGNFELVTDSPNDSFGGFIHRWRNNDAAGLPWIYAGQFFRRQVTLRWPSVIQDASPGSGKLHVVALATAPAGSQSLEYFSRLNNPTWAWSAPQALPASAGLLYSGNPVLIQSTARTGLSLEVYAPLVSGGFGHWYLDGTGWHFTGIYQTALGRISAMALIESSFGRLDMLIRRGGSLAWISRALAAADTGWTAPMQILNGAAGVPALIQSDYGRNGNFEVATANGNGGISGTWCNNDDLAHQQWAAPFAITGHFGDPGAIPGDGDVVGLLQSNFGTPGIGNLELIARRNGKTDFLWRLDYFPWTWSGPFRIATDPPDCAAMLRRAGTLESRLAGCDDLRSEITWETATGARILYDGWSRPQKDRLNQLFQRLLDGVADLGLDCPDPAANMALRVRPDGATCMFLTANQAFDTYAAHVAHVFYLEATGAVPWSILDLPSAEMQELLSSDRYHVRILNTPLASDPVPYYPAHILPLRDFQLPYRVQMTAKPIGLCCDPRMGYWFIRGMHSVSHADRLGPTDDATLANLTYWFSSNIGHGGEAVDSTPAYYIAHTYLQDRLRSEHRDWGYAAWTGIFSPSGCQSASNLLHDLARSVNIPLLNIEMTMPGEVHQGLLYHWQRADARIVHHTDDLYIATTLAPFYLVHADGTPASAAESVRSFFEVGWQLLDAMLDFGFHHSPSYDLSFSPAMDCPITGVSGGGWGSIAAAATFVLEKRYQLCSWRAFMEEYCAGRMSAADLTTGGAVLLHPYADYQARAALCAAAYGMCAGLTTLKAAWDAASGTDTWV